MADSSETFREDILLVSHACRPYQGFVCLMEKAYLLLTSHSKVVFCFVFKGILCDFFIFTLEQMIVLNTYSGGAYSGGALWARAPRMSKGRQKKKREKEGKKKRKKKRKKRKKERDKKRKKGRGKKK